MKMQFNVTNLVISEYWVNSFLTATRSRSSQVQLGNEGMQQCYSLKTAVLKTCFYSMEDLPRTLQKDSQGSGCQEKSQFLVIKSKVPERTNYIRKVTISGIFFNKKMYY